MKVKTDLFYEDWCEDKEERCYYHAYKADSGIFNHCSEFVDDLFRSGGDVQLAELNKMSFECHQRIPNLNLF
jgi:hypothetical protein